MKIIKFNDLQLQNIKYKKQFQQVFDKVLRKGNLILGDEVAAFEQEFAQFIGVKYGIGVASGTDALILSLISLDLKPQDEVIVPVNVYPVAFAVSSAGFKIKLVDIDPDTLNLDVTNLEKKITKNTKAIILVHLYGKAAPLKEVLRLAKKKNVTVIEDGSQAHGTIYQQKRVGSLGYIGCFSLYPTKNLGALGDGGIVVTNNRKIAEKIRALRQYGEVKRYESKLLGRVSRLDEIQAAFLRVKLKKINVELNQRIAKADLYLKNLADIDSIILPKYEKKFEHTFHLFVIRAKKRNELQAYLTKKGIQTGLHYPYLISELVPFAYLKHQKKDFPNATLTNRQILSLPFYPDIPLTDINYVCREIRKFYN